MRITADFQVQEKPKARSGESCEMGEWSEGVRVENSLQRLFQAVSQRPMTLDVILLIWGNFFKGTKRDMKMP